MSKKTLSYASCSGEDDEDSELTISDLPKDYTIKGKKPNYWDINMYVFWEDAPSCLVAFFCPCLTAGNLASTFGGNYLLNCIGCLLCCVTRPKLRQRIREYNGIPGGFPNDCVESTICPCCTLYQEEHQTITVPEGILEDNRSLISNGLVDHQPQINRREVSQTVSQMSVSYSKIN